MRERERTKLYTYIKSKKLSLGEMHFFFLFFVRCSREGLSLRIDERPLTSSRPPTIVITPPDEDVEDNGDLEEEEEVEVNEASFFSALII